MKKIWVFFSLFLLITISFSSIWAQSDEDAVRKLIADETKAESDFPKTRDVASILRFYSHDYTSITDGEGDDLKADEKYLKDLKKEMDRGVRINITSRASNIKVQIFSTIAWATYDSDYRYEEMGKVVADVHGKCTGIYKKEGLIWLIQHEHCSTPKAVQTDEERKYSPETTRK